MKKEFKTTRNEIPTGGSETTPDSSRKLYESLIDYRCIVQVIKNGIASRKFYILSSPEQIPGYRQSRNGQRLECVQRFAETNHWHVTVDKENGWFMFTSDELPLANSFENYFGKLGAWIESSMHAAH